MESKIGIILPINEKLHSNDDVRVTLNSIKSLNFSNYTLYTVSPTPAKVMNAIQITADFNSDSEAFNQALGKVNSEYLHFVIPGDEFDPSSYDNSDLWTHDVEIFNFYRKKNNKKKFVDVFTESIDYNNTDFTATLNYTYNKLFKLEIIKKFNISYLTQEQFNCQFLTKTKSFNFNNKSLLTHLVNTYSESELTKVGDYKQFRELHRVCKNISVKERLYDLFRRTLNIDFVFPYVDFNDPKWQKSYYRYLEIYKNTTEKNWEAGSAKTLASSPIRYRDRGFLKYLFRGIEKNLPWINKVHMIVARESQVPSWIDRTKVDIIFHDEFIPNELLPTFNSSEIEMFLPFLPRVSEKFIYGNDDLLCFKPCNPEEFFKDEIPCYEMTTRTFNSKWPGDILRLKAYNLINNIENNYITIATTAHSYVSYKKSWIKECFDEYKDKLLESCTRFREPKNFNQYVFSYYQAKRKEIKNIKQSIFSKNLRSSTLDNILKENFTLYQAICLNDDSLSQEDCNLIIKKMDSLLPNRSRFEIPDKPY